ncbi:MAG: hypothetical protein NZM10_02440 [Fimbriimonadales bacterium]|nr:hypothetical protein [Fimbriimonadales bacterium]
MRWMIVLPFGAIAVGATAREVVVIKPTANPNTPNAVYLELDSYRYRNASESYLAVAMYVQIKPSARFDFGLDRVHTDNGASAQTLWNLRYVASPETECTPGVAVGAFEIAPGAHPTVYLVGTRTLRQGALHAGVYLRRNQLGWGVAYQQPTALEIEVALEYYRQPGDDGLLSLCQTRPLREGVSVSVYTTANDRTRTLEVIGANVAFNL